MSCIFRCFHPPTQMFRAFNCFGVVCVAGGALFVTDFRYLQVLAKLPAVETCRSLKLLCHFFMANGEAITIYKVEMVLCESLLQLLSQGELSTELSFGTSKAGAAGGVKKLFGEATEQPLSCHWQLITNVWLQVLLVSALPKNPKTRGAQIQAELRAQTFYCHEETLTSVLVGCVFIPTQHCLGHFPVPLWSRTSRTTLHQRDEGPRPVGLKRNVCLWSWRYPYLALLPASAPDRAPYPFFFLSGGVLTLLSSFFILSCTTEIQPNLFPVWEWGRMELPVLSSCTHGSGRGPAE